jgi:ABC-type uncharacterized transport system substrate-binding protein
MRRRKFIAILGGAAVAWPMAARAQAASVPHVGLVSIGADSSDPVVFRPFLEQMRKLGYIDGHNIVLERRFAAGHAERIHAFVADLVRRNVDVIVVTGIRESIAAKQATSTIPIVASAAAEGSQGMIGASDGVVVARRKEIAESAINHRLPTIFAFRQNVEAGGLMMYAARVADLSRRAAFFVDRILKGAKPSELPIEQPTTFELVINLKTAKLLGLTIPPTLLAQADEVIE